MTGRFRYVPSAAVDEVPEVPIVAAAAALLTERPDLTAVRGAGVVLAENATATA